MHEFKITIKLENKDFCNGCPLLDWRADSEATVYNCGGYYTLSQRETDHTKPHNIIRPAICKESEEKC